MRHIRLHTLLLLLGTLCLLANTLTSSPTMSSNPTYSSAGINNIYISAGFTASNVQSPFTFTIPLAGRIHTTSTFSFGYSIQKIDYTISGKKLNYSLTVGTKTATSVSMRFYTDTSNRFNALTMAYIVIEPLFGLMDFQTAWIIPNSNMIDTNFFTTTVSGVGPYSSGTQLVWAALVGADATLTNNRIDLFATASLASTTSITFRISTISPSAFYLTSVVIQVFIFDGAQLQSAARAAKFSTAEINNLNSYSNTAIQGYNTIYSIRTYHINNNNFLIYSWGISNNQLTATSSNAFLWVGFSYLILQFITCHSTTPLLMLSTSLATAICYDVIPNRYYPDGYNELQKCLYDCYECSTPTACVACDSTTDFREFNSMTQRCDPISGYYQSGSTVAAACVSPCNTCSSASICLTCNTGYQLSGSTCVLICTSPCATCSTSATTCLTCISGYQISGSTCSAIICTSPCATCSTSATTCLTCISGYEISGSTCSAIICTSPCATCSTSATTCLTCISGYQISGSTCSAIICTSPCATCSTSATTCLTCISGYQISGSTCSAIICTSPCATCSTSATTCLTCISGYEISGSTCSAIICTSPCATCSTSATTCLTCISGYQISGSTCSAIICTSPCATCSTSATTCLTCISGYQISGSTCSAIICTSPCATCSTSATTCLTCISGYQISGSTCSAIICTSPCATCSTSATTCLTCISGYQISGSSCVAIPTTPTNCGDGVLDIGEGCDDGNLVSNDGCDASCQVEPFFTCASAPSVCNIASFSPFRVSLSKSSTANEFTLVYQLQPAGATAYSSLTWSSIVTQQSALAVSMMGSSFDTSNGQLTLQYSYTQDLNDNTLVLDVAFPNAVPYTNIQGATITQTLNQQDSNLSLNAYPWSSYINAAIVYVVSLVLSGFGLVMFIIGLFSRKIITLELVTIFQVAYLSLAALDRLSPPMHALRGLFLSCGFALNIFRSGPVINKFSAINMQASLVDNYNFSLMLVFLPMIASLVVRAIPTGRKEQPQIEYMASLEKRLRGEWVFCAIMFSLYILVVSLGLSIIGISSIKLAGMIGLGVAVFLIIIAVYLLNKIVRKRQEMGEFIEYLRKQNGMASNYYLLMAIERCLTASSLLLTILNSKLILLTVGIAFVQIIMVAALKPYQLYGKRKRPIINLTFTALILTAYFLTQLPQLADFEPIFPFIILGLLAVSLCFNIYYLIKNRQSERIKVVESQKSDDNRAEFYLPDQSFQDVSEETRGKGSPLRGGNSRKKSRKIKGVRDYKSDMLRYDAQFS